MTPELLRLEEIAERCELSPELVHRFVLLGLIDPDDEGAELFQPEVVLRIHRIVRIHDDLGVNYSGTGVILDLLDRIDELEARLRHFERW
jgi:DNA-binding transcriptional MerR regulator